MLATTTLRSGHRHNWCGPGLPGPRRAARRRGVERGKQGHARGSRRSDLAGPLASVGLRGRGAGDRRAGDLGQGGRGHRFCRGVRRGPGARVRHLGDVPPFSALACRAASMAPCRSRHDLCAHCRDLRAGVRSRAAAPSGGATAGGGRRRRRRRCRGEAGVLPARRAMARLALHRPWMGRGSSGASAGRRARGGAVRAPRRAVASPTPWERRCSVARGQTRRRCTFGYHEIWHGCTVLAAACHFAMVTLVVAR